MMKTMTSRLRYVTLDATGTLLRPRARIGATYIDHYLRFALPSSLSLSPSRRDALERHVDAAFPLAFRQYTKQFPAFGRRTLSSETAQPWWHRVILASIPQDLVDALPGAAQRELTASLYAYFACGDAWRVYDDVYGALETLREMDVRMAVISDFDERLPRLLDDLKLADFFENVTTSWGVGDAKPSPALFRQAFQALGPSDPPSVFLHVGDHVVRDYKGARAAGADARLLQRHRQDGKVRDDVPSEHIVTTLADIVPILQEQE